MTFDAIDMVLVAWILLLLGFVLGAICGSFGKETL